MKMERRRSRVHHRQHYYHRGAREQRLSLSLLGFRIDRRSGGETTEKLCVQRRWLREEKMLLTEF